MILFAVLCLLGVFAMTPPMPPVQPHAQWPLKQEQRDMQHELRANEFTDCNSQEPQLRDLTRTFSPDGADAAVTMCPDE